MILQLAGCQIDLKSQIGIRLLFTFPDIHLPWNAS